MKTQRLCVKYFFGSIIISILSLAPSVCTAATLDVIGSFGGWNSISWQPISAQSDGHNPGLPAAEDYLDIVGSAADPGAYWADDGTFIYARMRLHEPNMTSVPAPGIRGAHFIMIDVQDANYDTDTSSLVTGVNDGLPDYAFAWDSKSNQPLAHGLEMLNRPVPNWSNGTLWNGINFDDIDNNDGQKLVNDINGNGRTTDGYVRIVDQVATSTDFDGNGTANTTSFLEFAVSWNYLTTYTDLDPSQTWNIALATIRDATDHNNLNGDIGGGASLTDPPTEGWTPIPEPATMLLMFSGLVLMNKHRRSR